MEADSRKVHVNETWPSFFCFSGGLADFDKPGVWNRGLDLRGDSGLAG